MIPARRRWFAIPFLCAWLVGWAFGEVFAIRQVLRGNEPGPELLFVAVWLALWTAGGAAAIAAIIWGIAGREVISLASATFGVRREAFGIGRTWEYDSAQVLDLRVAPAAFNPFEFGSSLRLWGLGGGVIAFDYGARTHRFGAGVDEAEAASIVSALRERMPSRA